MGQGLAFFLKTLPDLLPALVIKPESGRKNADRLTPVVGYYPGFFQFSGHLGGQLIRHCEEQSDEAISSTGAPKVKCQIQEIASLRSQ